MTTDEMRKIYGDDFLNQLSMFLDELGLYDETPESSCKRLINWFDQNGYRITYRTVHDTY
jgi:hypothetical protein